MTAFYLPDGDRLIATPLTRGPWHLGLQHGGPPSALLVRALEGLAPTALCARTTIELLRPIPVGPVRVHAALLPGGRQVQRGAATLTDDGGLELARATAVLIRQAEVAVPAPRPDVLTPGPDGGAPFEFPFFLDPVGYQAAVEVRLARGVWNAGPAAAWMRQRVPLVAGEPDAPLPTLVCLADAANGICPALSTGTHTFVNPDLTVAVRRPPRGTWFGLDVASVAEPTGTGLCRAALYDEHGRVGDGLQTLLVSARG